MTNSTSGLMVSSQLLTCSKGPNSGRHSSVPVSPRSYTCSMEGACDAPMPPRILAMSGRLPGPVLPHLPPDLDERRARHPDELDHGVDRHPAPPQIDPVAIGDHLP